MATQQTQVAPPLVHERALLDELVQAYRRDLNPRTLDEIFEACEWTIRHVVHRTRWHGEPIDDPIQVARIGLLGAISRFDSTHGVAFRTFAESTMVGVIRHHHRHALQMKVPRDVQDLNAACRRASERLTATLQRMPTSAEVAAELGVCEPDVVDAMEVDQLFHPVSLSSTSDGHDNALDERVGRDDVRLTSADDRSDIHGALTGLPSRQRTILFLHFYDGRTQTEIGAELGISQVQVSRLMSKALAALRHSCTA